MIITISPVIKHLGDHSFTGVIDAYFEPEVEIGNYSSIASILYVHGATEHPSVFNRKLVSTFPFGDKEWGDYPKSQSKGKIIIGSDVWIGEGVTLLSGVKIGDGAIVGARTVVAKDIAPYAIVVGNPARIVRYRFSEDVIAKLLKIRWWMWPEVRIREALPLMQDIDLFLSKYGI